MKIQELVYETHHFKQINDYVYEASGWIVIDVRDDFTETEHKEAGDIYRAVSDLDPRRKMIKFEFLDEHTNMPSDQIIGVDIKKAALPLLTKRLGPMIDTILDKWPGPNQTTE